MTTPSPGRVPMDAPGVNRRVVFRAIVGRALIIGLGAGLGSTVVTALVLLVAGGARPGLAFLSTGAWYVVFGGAIIGLPVGLVAGLLNGLVLAAIATRWFLPPQDPRPVRRAFVAASVALSSSLGIVVGWPWFMAPVIPIVWISIVVMAAAISARMLANWYVERYGVPEPAILPHGADAPGDVWPPPPTALAG